MKTNSIVNIRRLHPSSDAEVKRLVDILVAAFKDDPSHHIFLGEDKSLLPIKFESNVRACSVGGEINVASVGPTLEDIIGVALWYGPGTASMATDAQREVGVDRFFDRCPGVVKKMWMDNFLPSMGRLAEESLGPGFKEAQWALLLLAVVPEHQRQGIAREMLKAGEQRAKADGVSVVLETMTDLDILIYKRLNFEVKGKVTIKTPFGEFPVYQLMKAL